MNTDCTDISFPGHSDSLLDEAGVHKIRKGTKQLRARLQLLRQLEGRKDDTEKLRQSVKALARMLAAQRDADVMAEALQELSTRTEEPEVKQLLATLGEALQPEPLATAERQRIHRLIKEINKSAKKLKSHHHEIAEVDSILNSRLATLCAMGRELLSGTDWEALHDWRKQVKKLMYQYQLKGALSPKDLFVYEHLDQLGTSLGNINDMRILEEFIRSHQYQTTRARELTLYETIHQLIEGRRQEALESSKSIFQAINNLL